MSSATPVGADSGAPAAPTGVALTVAHNTDDDPFDPNLRVGVGMGWTSIQHQFSKGGELRRRTLAASIAWRPLESLTLLGDVGALIDGDLTVGEQRHRVEAGPRAGIGITWRVYGGDTYWPYVMFGASFTVLSSTTELSDARERLTHLDFRSAIVVGKLFGGEAPGRRLGPYLVARSVTGALYWHERGRSVSAQPDDLFQIGLGLNASAGDFDAFAEVVPFGERAAVVGGGFSF